MRNNSLNRIVLIILKNSEIINPEVCPIFHHQVKSLSVGIGLCLLSEPSSLWRLPEDHSFLVFFLTPPHFTLFSRLCQLPTQENPPKVPSRFTFFPWHYLEVLSF